MIGIEDVLLAQDRIAGECHRTPLLTSRLGGERAGGYVFLKAENLQRTGSFKFRGATNALACLSKPDLRQGVTTYSSGNHGQALALAARRAGARAVIFMPEDAPPPKVEAARSYGAEVRFAGTTSSERRAAAEAAAREEGLHVVPPFDDPRIVAGQGTVGLEILEQCADFDLLLVPVGGGGLLAGIALAVAARRPAAEIIGVEPEAASAMQRAIEAGGPVAIEPRPTVADGLKPLRAGDLTYEVARGRVARIETVSDSDILAATRFLLLRSRLVVEPSGAAALALLLSGRLPLEGRRAVVVLSGGNIDPLRLVSLLQPSP